MASPVSIRLSEATRQRVARIARRKNARPTALMQSVIEQWAEQEDGNCRPYDSIVDLIGVVDGGDPTRSTWSRAKIARLLKSRRRHN